MSPAEMDGGAHSIREDIDGRQALDLAFDSLLREATHEIRIFEVALDARFATATRMEVLHRFLRSDPRNRVRIALHDTGTLARDCPRLLALQSKFAASLAIHETGEQARVAADPLALADQRVCLHRFHHTRTRAVLLRNDAESIAPLSARFEQIWEGSSPAVSGTILGL